MSTYSLIIRPASENNPELKIDTLKIKKASIVVRAINHKLRQVMLQLIGERDKITVTEIDRKSTRLNSSHIQKSRMPSSA